MSKYGTLFSCGTGDCVLYHKAMFTDLFYFILMQGLAKFPRLVWNL